MKTAMGLFIVMEIVMAISVPALSDEGMWLYNDPPRGLFEE